MEIIEVKGLTKQYGDLVAVNDVDFSVQEREIFGFLGPNGAGKTTTIKMLTGLTRATSGDISIDGVDCVRAVKMSRASLGLFLTRATFMTN